MSDFNYSLRTKIIVAFVLMPVVIVCIFVFMFYKHCRRQIVYSSLQQARSICVLAESVYEDVESASFTRDLVERWCAPMYAVSGAEAGDGFEFKIIEKRKGNLPAASDDFEVRGLEKLKSKELKEYYEINPSFNQLRLIRPVEYSQRCSTCHGSSSDTSPLWVDGRAEGDGNYYSMNCDANGNIAAFTVTAEMKGAKKQLARSVISAGILLVAGLSFFTLALFAIVILLIAGRDEEVLAEAIGKDNFNIAEALAETTESSKEPDKCQI